MANRDFGFQVAMLIGFFSFFCKSNLVPKSAKDYNPSKTLSCEHIIVRPWGLVICVQWSKTIQFKHRKLLTPVVCLPCITPCVRCRPTFLHFRADYAMAITHSVFTAKLLKSLSLAGLQASHYSGHSFRRGGVTYAFPCGASIKLISLQGEWSSDAVLLYLAQSLECHLFVAHLIVKNIISSST